MTPSQLLLGEAVMAITVQQSIAAVIALAVVVGWALWLLANVRRSRPEVGSEIELAANRKLYLNDDELEGPKLDRALSWGLVSLAIVGVGLPLYWLAEPGRMSGAIDNFDSTFASRGAGLFAATAEGGFGCAGCHGGQDGLGGDVPFTLTEGDSVRQVQWAAPSLNDVTLRMTEDQLRDVLVFGRPFSPMPAWGLEGGGPLNEQQIDNLIAYLYSIEISPEAAREQAVTRAQEELERITDLEDALDAAEAELAALQEASFPDEEQRDRLEGLPAIIEGLEIELSFDQQTTIGAALFNTSCARCHTLGWSYDEPTPPGSGAFGPPLDNVLRQFPDRSDHIDFVTNGAERGASYGVNGQSSGRMPYFGQVLTSEQIAAIVAYERIISEQAIEEGAE